MNNNLIINKPNLFIVGAAKAGTTSLYHYLGAHPEIYMCPIKEPLFFGKDIRFEDFRADHKRTTKIDFKAYFAREKLEKRHIAYVEKEGDYLGLFREAGNAKVLGEASTSYLYSKKAAQEIYDFNPEAKIIIILRDPIERTISHFLMDYAQGKQGKENIRMALEKDYKAPLKGYCISNLYLDLSLYYEQVQRYYSVFPKEQIIVLHYDDLKNCSSAVLNTIFSFLDVKIVEMDHVQAFNVTKKAKNKIFERLKVFKPIIPHSLKEKLLKNENLFFESVPKSAFPEDAKNYVREIVKEDWKKVTPFISRIQNLK